MSKSFDAMPFYSKNLGEAWEKASTFAGLGGRVATLLDIIDARLASPPNGNKCTTAWDNYFTTTSAEYAGISKGGTPILIVAHGVHPMSTLKGAVRAYKTKDDNKRYGSIPHADFLKLEAGAYGEVSIVDLEPIRSRYTYPFMEPLTAEMIAKEPLMHARLGPRWHEYVQLHERVAYEWQKQQGHQTNVPYLLQMGDAGNSSYMFPNEAPLSHHVGVTGAHPCEALGHLLALGQLVHTNYHEIRPAQFVSEIGLHERSNGCRMLGLKEGAAFKHIARNMSADDLLKAHWKKLLVPNTTQPKNAKLRRIMQFSGKTYFSQPLKSGQEMDSRTAEFPVKVVRKLSSLRFTTDVNGYYGFFSYDLKKVEAIAPVGANAYTLDKCGLVDGSDAGQQFGDVTFYAVEFDTKQRLMTKEELEADTGLLIELTQESSS